MLWYKSWLDTRWRFLIGLGLLLLSACGVAISFTRVQELVRIAPTLDVGGILGQQIRENAELMRTFRGYIFAQWYRDNLLQLWVLLAALLGSGGLLASGSEGAALFTLSLPITRSQLVTTRAATGMAQLFALALLPSLAIALFAPAVGQRYSLADVAVHSFCLFAAGMAFFHLALYLSTAFHDMWRPFLIALCAAFALRFFEARADPFGPFGLFEAMSGETYFRGGGLPWPGLLLSAAASAALLYGAALNLARRDF